MADGLATYRLADFVPLGREAWYRLIERYNGELFPAHLAALAAGLALLWLARRPGPGGGRAALLILAGAWAWAGWGFLLEWYAPLNWAARWMAAAFGLQALLLAMTAFAGAPRLEARADGAARAGFGVAAAGLLLLPLLGVLAGRDWGGMGLFAMTPDPTAVVTLGLVLVLAGRVRWELLALPVLWSALTGAYAWVLGAWEGFAPAAAALAVLAAAALRAGRGAARR